MSRLSRKFFAPGRFICAWQQAPRLYPHFVGETRNDSEYKRGRSYARRRTHASLPRFYALPPDEIRDSSTRSDAPESSLRCCLRTAFRHLNWGPWEHSRQNWTISLLFHSKFKNFCTMCNVGARSNPLTHLLIVSFSTAAVKPSRNS